MSMQPTGICVCCNRSTITTYAHMVSLCKGCFESGIFGQVFPDLIKLIREKIFKEEGYESPRYHSNGLYDRTPSIRKERKPVYW